MSCAVKWCKNSRRFNLDGAHFQLFPRGDLLPIWKNVLGLDENWKWTPNKYVCSNHFKDDDYLEINSNRRLLKRNAVPFIEDAAKLQICKLATSMANVGDFQPEQSPVSAVVDFTAKDILQTLITDIDEDFTPQETFSDEPLPITYTEKEPFVETRSNIMNPPIILSEEKPEVCMLCLSISELQPITTAPLAQEFNNFVFFEAEIGHDLPEDICKECLTKLNDHAAFIKMCKDSMAKIEEYQEINEQSTIDKNCSSLEPINDEKNNLQIYEPEVQTISGNEVVIASKNAELEINILPKTAYELYVSNELVQEDTANEVTSLPEKLESKTNTSLTLSDHSYYKLDDQTQTCPECHETVTTLTSHYNKQKSCRPKRIRCYICSMRFTDRQELRLHQTSRHSDKMPIIQAICHICSKTFKHASNLRRHLMLHNHARQQYKCDQCDRSYTSALQLEDHLNIHLNIKPYLCEDCGKQFFTKSRLYIHGRVHNKCNLKKSNQSSTAEPGDHDKNPENELVACEICDRHFLEHGLKIHMRSHNEKKTHTCQKCKVHFETPMHYRQHLKTHAVKDAMCPHCFKMYSQYGLKMHIKIHTEGRPFPCPECDKRFRTQMHLANHRLAIHNVNRGKGWKCKYCDKSFNFKGNLSVHERIHTGEKPYDCHLCNEAFSDTKKRKNHVAQAHGEDEIENINCNFLATVEYD